MEAKVEKPEEAARTLAMRGKGHRLGIFIITIAALILLFGLGTTVIPSRVWASWAYALATRSLASGFGSDQPETRPTHSHRIVRNQRHCRALR
jgi:hypothetical protein